MSSIFREHVPQDKRSDRSAGDRERHRQKIRKLIKENIADIIAEESIIGQNKDKIIKIPIRTIKEYRFIYGDNSPGVAQGNGNSKTGTVVGKAEQGQPDASGQAGNQGGVDAIETDVTLDELINIMFEDMELPELKKKALKQIETDQAMKRKGHRKQGIQARLDKKKTAKNRIKRKLATDRLGNGLDYLEDHDDDDDHLDDLDPNLETLNESKNNTEKDEERFPFNKNDLSYFHIKPDVRQQSNAVVICIMDTSGSMGTVKKYLARNFYFLLYQFVRMKYQAVEIVFIAHHTEAKEVTEDEFFHKVESGGTYISSGYKKALEIIEDRYHPSLWNVYAFHCSDGDNFYSDNEKAIQAAQELCDVCNLFGYGEIKPSGSAYYSGSMLEVFEKIDRDNFQCVVIEKKEDLWNAFKKFMSKDPAVREAVLSDK